MTEDKRPVGRTPLTWLALIAKDLSKTLEKYKIKTPLNKNSLERLKTLAGDRKIWREEMARRDVRGRILKSIDLVSTLCAGD